MRREEFEISTVDPAVSRRSRQTPGSESVLNRENVGNSSPRRKASLGFNALCIGVLIVIVFAIVVLCVGFIIKYENEGEAVGKIDLFVDDLPSEQAVWFESNLAELRNAFRVKDNKRRAKNVVLFVALDSHEVTNGAPRPIWESFPHLAMFRTTQERPLASFNPTSLFCGIEARSHTIGFDSAVEPWSDCVSMEHLTHRAPSVVQWAQDIGRRTGVITNGEIVDPFPAALYAHTPNASWVYSTPDSVHCPDVRSQLLQGETGRQLNVIAGALACPEEFCHESFRHEWQARKNEDGSSYKISTNVQDLLENEDDDWEYALGIYDQRVLAVPNAFHDLTLGALHVLDSPEGFLLIAVVDPKVGISIQELDVTVRSTLRKLSHAVDDSLVVVIRSDRGNDRPSPYATVHATGPMSHLLHRVHNQTFLAHFVAYAARIGRFRDSDLTNLVLKIF
ncbi:alkaline phosphatase 4-like [Anopheles nili]|uniref:alkaline phosphatase 4-like n=1 Tax=Anopheles nili TaxID=185578 RepID=UPI00237ADEEE|nr:alkaline phosphatase 4-like [Anopheles nili]